jgi:hypothetical protein
MRENIPYIGFLISPLVHETPIRTSRHDVLDFSVEIEFRQTFWKCRCVLSSLEVVHENPEGTR